MDNGNPFNGPVNLVGRSRSAENSSPQTNYSAPSGYSLTSSYPHQMGYLPRQSMATMPPDITPREQQYAIRKLVDTETEMAKEVAKTQNSMAVHEHKTQMGMLRDENRIKLQEEVYERRQLTVLAVSVNSDGCFEIERISPDGTRRHSASICNQRNFLGTYFYAADSAPEENILKITWQGEVDGIILSGAKMTTMAMGRELSGRGVCFRISRREKTEILERILGYILENAQKIEVPRTIGWTQNSKGEWKFEAEIENTLIGMRGVLCVIRGGEI